MSATRAARPGPETAWQGERVHAPLVVWANDSAWQGTLDYEMSDLTGGDAPGHPEGPGSGCCISDVCDGGPGATRV